MRTSYLIADAARKPDGWEVRQQARSQFARRAALIVVAVLTSVLVLASGGNAIVALLPLLSGTSLLTSGFGSQQALRPGSRPMPSTRRRAVVALAILGGLCAAVDTMIGGLIASFFDPSARHSEFYLGALFILSVPAYIADIRSERSLCVWMMAVFACRWMAGHFAARTAFVNPFGWPSVPMGVLLFAALVSGQASKWLRPRE